MKRLFALTCALFALTIIAFTQSQLDTTNITVSLPVKLDTSTALATFTFASTIASAFLTIALGFFKNWFKWLTPIASTTSQRTTIVGIAGSLVVIIIALVNKNISWGFNEAISLAFAVMVGVFKGQEIYDKTMKSQEIKTEA